MISIAIPTLNIAIKQLDWQLANETLKALCGHTVRLHIKPPEMIFDVTFTPEHPVIHTKLDDQPDCTITLSPSDALKMSLDQKAHISFNGDIHIATHFKKSTQTIIIIDRVPMFTVASRALGLSKQTHLTSCSIHHSAS